PDPVRLSRLPRPEDPLGEPGVGELLGQTAVRFVETDPEIDRADVVLVAVVTPMRPDGHADLVQVDEVSRSIAFGVRPGAVVAIRSTVPVGTCDRLHNDELCLPR